MKILDALLKAGIIVMLYFILAFLVRIEYVFTDVHLIRQELSTIANRLDGNMIKFEVKP